MSSFLNFPDLPAELRQLIWHEVASAPRLVTLDGLGGRNPTMLYVNRESREIALRYYFIKLRLRDPESHNNATRTYVMAEHDIIALTDSGTVLLLEAYDQWIRDTEREITKKNQEEGTQIPNYHFDLDDYGAYAEGFAAEVTSAGEDAVSIFPGIDRVRRLVLVPEIVRRLYPTLFSESRPPAALVEPAELLEDEFRKAPTRSACQYHGCFINGSPEPATDTSGSNPVFRLEFTAVFGDRSMRYFLHDCWLLNTAFFFSVPSGLKYYAFPALSRAEYLRLPMETESSVDARPGSGLYREIALELP